LGNSRITERNKLSYFEAELIVKELKFKTQIQFLKWVKNQNIYNIPKSPDIAYLNQGWKDWGTFLGNKKNRTYLSFEESKKWAHQSGIKTAKEWKIAKKKDNLPNGVPGHPQIIYLHNGWVNWADFLGTENHREIEYLKFEEAQEYVRNQKLKTTSEWKTWSKTHRPFNIPGAPDAIYKGKGWIGWADFLGADIILKGNKLDYDQAKKIISPFKIRSSVSWREFVKSDEMPQNVPANPDREYKNKGWKGWADFLGKEEKE
jgi:hypothetical protein